MPLWAGEGWSEERAFFSMLREQNRRGLTCGLEGVALGAELQLRAAGYTWCLQQGVRWEACDYTSTMGGEEAIGRDAHTCRWSSQPAPSGKSSAP